MGLMGSPCDVMFGGPQMPLRDAQKGGDRQLRLQAWPEGHTFSNK